MMNRTTEEAVNRILQMEQLFDQVTDAIHHAPQTLHTPSAQTAVRTLSEYLSGGDWLNDYELDAQRRLPPTLKRGVLSQDGLYSLLQRVAEFHIL